MRLLLFTGKGGVGKTTIAAATGVHAARCGLRTLVVSADAAHSLADVMGVELGPDTREIEPGLWGRHLDGGGRAERSWRTVQEYLVGVLDGLGVDPLAAEELTALPGAEEILALLEVRDVVMTGDWDLIVLDCAPTAETVRLLALPEVLDRCLDRALPVERRVLRALAAGSRRTALQAPRDYVVEAVERLQREVAGAHEALTQASVTVRIVLTPESVVVAEARRAWTTLALYGYSIDGVVANRIVPPGGRDPWRASWSAAQTERLLDVDASFAPLPVLRVGYAEREPVGTRALAALGRELYGAPSPAAGLSLLVGSTGPAPLQVERDGAEYVLALVLPLADRRDVDLSRRGDDLIIVLDGRRRVVSLPSGLRRCRVVGARLRDGILRVRFEPDPALWRPL